MSLWKPLRIAYIKTTDLTHGYQGSVPARLLRFYALWAPIYDLTVRLDRGYPRNLQCMVESVVRPGDTILDVGSGTGLGTVCAGGRLGLFAAQGVIAATLQTREEIERQLGEAGFAEIENSEVSDIYRITTATRP